METELIPAAKKNLAAQYIRDGKLVAIPTETVYGLAADAFNEKSVKKLYEAKKRPFFDPMIVHVAKRGHISTFSNIRSYEIDILVNRFWPGPLTIVVPKRNNVPNILTAGHKGVGIRMPANQLTLDVIYNSGYGVVAPSANMFGRTSPTTAKQVMEEMGGRIDAVLDGGPCKVGVESTVISFMDKTPVCLRLGGTPIEKIRDLMGNVYIGDYEGKVDISPGRSESHYAPRIPLYLHKKREDFHSDSKIMVIKFGEDLDEAARHLYSDMKWAEKMGYDLILAELVEDAGIGKAINDRLRRASVDGRFDPPAS